MAATATPKFKMILLGDFGVGKTTLFHRVRTGRFLEEPHSLGQNVYVCEKTLPLKHGRSQPLAQICLWDTAGEERFLSLSSCYYRDADAALLLYSLPRPLSFDSLSHWLCVARQYCADAEVFVLGNKSDLESHIPEEKVERFVAEHAISGRYKVSAKTGENVERSLQDILERLLLQKEFQRSGLQTSLPEVGYYSHCAC